MRKNNNDLLCAELYCLVLDKEKCFYVREYENTRGLASSRSILEEKKDNYLIIKQLEKKLIEEPIWNQFAHGVSGIVYIPKIGKYTKK